VLNLEFPGTVALTAAAAVLLLLIAVIAGAAGGLTGQEAAACTAQPAASSAAAAIPADYLADFQKAGAEYGIPWTVLAAIGEVESSFGRNDGPSSAGALGPPARSFSDVPCVAAGTRMGWRADQQRGPEGPRPPEARPGWRGFPPRQHSFSSQEVVQADSL
jgi:hypothetical protein